MPIDATRAAFVKQPFRYETVEDSSILDDYPAKAREIVLDTNLVSSTDAATFATNYFAAESGLARAFEIEIEGTITPDDLVGSRPRYTVDFSELTTDSRTLTLIACSVDHVNNKTRLVVRG